MRIFRNKKGLSPVVATVILCGMVLTIGISVWSYTYNLTNYLGENYLEGVQEQIDVICERFIVEHISYDSVNGALYVWVFNYGNADIDVMYSNLDINVDVYVFKDGERIGSNTDSTLIESGSFAMISVSLSTSLNPGNELVIEVISRRQNVVYQTYIVTL